MRNSSTNIIRLIVLLISLQICSLPLFAARELPKYLLKMPGVVDIDTLASSNYFTEKYLVIFRQPLDYNNPAAGYFNQRVFVCHYGINRPVIFETEGYSASYAEYPNYINELSSLFAANQIVVEHRYFDKSVPDSIDWQYLTTENAAGDLHNIYQAFKTLYKDKWISAGISKGGENALLYNMYYPEDMDISIAYVCPLAFAVDDTRYKTFMDNIGFPADRKKVLSMQKEFLKRRNDLVPMLESYSKMNKLTYRVPIDEVFDYLVLEFSYAFWQWGTNITAMPSTGSNDATIFKYLISVMSPDYFSIESSNENLAMYYQSARELGYYGYDIEPFLKLLKITSTEGYLSKVFLPSDLQVNFDTETSLQLKKFMQNKAVRTVLIYGEFDPWTALAVDVSKNQNVLKVIAPGGSHMSRIKTLPKTACDNVINTINSWLVL